MLADVARGYVTRDSARADYGVALDGLTPDPAETARLRAAMAEAAGPATEFGHGPFRLAYESVWTRARYDRLTAILAAIPVPWRFFVKHRIFQAIGDRADDAGDGADVAAAFAALRARFPDLPAADMGHAAGGTEESGPTAHRTGEPL